MPYMALMQELKSLTRNEVNSQSHGGCSVTVSIPKSLIGLARTKKGMSSQL